MCFFIPAINSHQLQSNDISFHDENHRSLFAMKTVGHCRAILVRADAVPHSRVSAESRRTRLRLHHAMQPQLPGQAE